MPALCGSEQALCPANRAGTGARPYFLYSVLLDTPTCMVSMLHSALFYGIILYYETPLAPPEGRLAMREQRYLPVLLGALGLLLTVAILAQSSSARAVSPRLSGQQVYEHDTAQSFTIDARVPLTTPTPIQTFTPTPNGITPSPTYAGPPDLVGQLNWIGSCPNPVLACLHPQSLPVQPHHDHIDNRTHQQRR